MGVSLCSSARNTNSDGGRWIEITQGDWLCVITRRSHGGKNTSPSETRSEQLGGPAEVCQRCTIDENITHSAVTPLSDQYTTDEVSTVRWRAETPSSVSEGGERELNVQVVCIVLCVCPSKRVVGT